MDTDYNKEIGVKTWLLNRWYQKTVYVIGHIAFWYLAFCFVVGGIAGVWGIL